MIISTTDNQIHFLLNLAFQRRVFVVNEMKKEKKREEERRGEYCSLDIS
jgi:hypothetical protein